VSFEELIQHVRAWQREVSLEADRTGGPVTLGGLIVPGLSVDIDAGDCFCRQRQACRASSWRRRLALATKNTTAAEAEASRAETCTAAGH
jgi:hypothetical protein